MKRAGLVVLMGMLLIAAGCKKKVAPAAAAPKPVESKVVVDSGPRPALSDVPRIESFTAEPARVERGQAITLRWTTTGATEVSIDQGIGTVPATGSRQLFPTGTTTYVMIARGGTGSDTRTVTVEVVAPPPVTPVKPTATGDGAEAVRTMIGQLQDIYFDYDMSDLREDSRRALNTDADLLKRIFAADPRVNFIIEGHADERGSAEYNLGLADRRAIVVRDSLIQLGVAANRLRTISYGEEAPVCRDAAESCWQRNRRAHISAAQ